MTLPILRHFLVAGSKCLNVRPLKNASVRVRVVLNEMKHSRPPIHKKKVKKVYPARFAKAQFARKCSFRDFAGSTDAASNAHRSYTILLHFRFEGHFPKHRKLSQTRTTTYQNKKKALQTRCGTHVHVLAKIRKFWHSCSADCSKKKESFEKWSLSIIAIMCFISSRTVP